MIGVLKNEERFLRCQFLEIYGECSMCSHTNTFNMFHADTDSPTVPPDPVVSRDDEPPAGGGVPPPSVPNPDSVNASPEHQPADSWEEAAVDGDPLLTPENEEVRGFYEFLCNICQPIACVATTQDCWLVDS